MEIVMKKECDRCKVAIAPYQKRFIYQRKRYDERCWSIILCEERAELARKQSQVQMFLCEANEVLT